MGTSKTTSVKVFDLAKANIKAKDEDKAIKALERQVRDNQHAWANSTVNAQRAVENAEDELEALKSDVTATAEQFLAANDTLALAQRNVDTIADLAGKRF